MRFNPDAAKIKRWREERSWSQDHLAHLAGIGLRTVQRIENGESASSDSVMALAAAFNVDAMALTLDANTAAEQAARQKEADGIAALRLSFFIHLASYVFGMIVFTGISLSDSNGIYDMAIPAIWWTVGLAGHGLAVVLVELVTYFKRQGYVGPET